MPPRKAEGVDEEGDEVKVRGDVEVPVGEFAVGDVVELSGVFEVIGVPLIPPDFGLNGELDGAPGLVLGSGGPRPASDCLHGGFWAPFSGANFALVVEEGLNEVQDVEVGEVLEVDNSGERDEAPGPISRSGAPCPASERLHSGVWALLWGVNIAAVVGEGLCEVERVEVEVQDVEDALVEVHDVEVVLVDADAAFLTLFSEGFFTASMSFTSILVPPSLMSSSVELASASNLFACTNVFAGLSLTWCFGWMA